LLEPAGNSSAERVNLRMPNDVREVIRRKGCVGLGSTYAVLDVIAERRNAIGHGHASAEIEGYAGREANEFADVHRPKDTPNEFVNIETTLAKPCSGCSDRNVTLKRCLESHTPSEWRGRTRLHHYS
jgi:hypothetical protein